MFKQCMCKEQPSVESNHYCTLHGIGSHMIELHSLFINCRDVFMVMRLLITVQQHSLAVQFAVLYLINDKQIWLIENDYYWRVEPPLCLQYLLMLLMYRYLRHVSIIQTVNTFFNCQQHLMLKLRMHLSGNLSKT